MKDDAQYAKQKRAIRVLIFIMVAVMLPSLVAAVYSFRAGNMSRAIFVLCFGLIFVMLGISGVLRAK